MHKLVLASKSKVRYDILTKFNIKCIVEHSNVDEEPVKQSLLNEGATPEIISKNLAELKANKVSQKLNDSLVLGADSVIDLALLDKELDRVAQFQLVGVAIKSVGELSYDVTSDGKVQDFDVTVTYHFFRQTA